MFVFFVKKNNSSYFIVRHQTLCKSSAGNHSKNISENALLVLLRLASTCRLTLNYYQGSSFSYPIGTNILHLAHTLIYKAERSTSLFQRRCILTVGCLAIIYTCCMA